MKGRGQALVELALVAPLFVLFFWIACQFTFLFHCRLRLISLKREFALGRGRLASGPDSDQALLRTLANHVGLDVRQLTLRVDPAGIDSSGSIPWLPASWLGSDRISISYAYHFSGVADRLFPGGLTLEENVVCKTGFWKAGKP